MNTAVLAAVGTSPEPGLLVRYSETRIGPFGFAGETRTEPLVFVSTSTHRACGDPWLGLTKDLSFFGQEDPAGTVDSQNRYQALGGRWNGATDPLGLYEEDVHHYLTMYLAEKAGFPRQVASRIGYETGHLDFDSRDAMEGSLGRNLALGAFGSRENEQLYHFAKPDRQRQMSEYAMGRPRFSWTRRRGSRVSQEKERMSKDKQENGRAPGAAPESPNAGPLAPGQRWSLARKRDVALRLLRSEPVDALSRTLGVEIYVLDDWRDRALAGIENGLREREGDPLQDQLSAAVKRVGELSMENELLKERCRRNSPLARRRSKR